MKKLQLPSSYAALSARGAAPPLAAAHFGRMTAQFSDHLHFNDFFWSGGLISFSFTFVPMLLFRVVKTGFRSVERSHLAWHPREATVTAVQYLDNTQQRYDQPVEILSPAFFFSNKL